MLIFGDEENYRTTDRDSDSSESSEEEHFPVEILEHIFFEDYETAEDFGIFTFCKVTFINN